MQPIVIGWPQARVQDENGLIQAEADNVNANGAHLLDYGSYVNSAGDIVESNYERARLTGITIDRTTGIITANCEDKGSQPITIGCIAIGSVTNPNGVTNLGNNYYKASEGSGEMCVSLCKGTAATIGISHINKELYTKTDENDAEEGDAYPDSLRIRDAKVEMISNGLEMSKTDLAQEIANMILTQRGYQANTRIVTVTDSMLEELVNMKR